MIAIHMHLKRLCLCSLLVVGAALTSCSMLDWKANPVTERHEHPMLAAARAGQITLFGDLHNRFTEGYFTRSAVSLKRHTFAEIGGDSDADRADVEILNVAGFNGYEATQEAFDGVACVVITKAS